MAYRIQIGYCHGLSCIKLKFRCEPSGLKKKGGFNLKGCKVKETGQRLPCASCFIIFYVVAVVHGKYLICELIRLFLFSVQIVRMLTDKCKEQEAVIAEYEMRDEQYEQLESETRLLHQQMEGAR